MPWAIHVLPPAEAFLAGLETDEYEMFLAALTKLEEHGPNLGEPLVKRIVTSDHKNMKELRRQSKGRIYRVLFAMDAKRRAAILTGGDKAEIGFDDFYEIYVPIADALFTAHQADCANEIAAEKAAAKAPGKKKRGK